MILMLMMDAACWGEQQGEYHSTRWVFAYCPMPHTNNNQQQKAGVGGGPRSHFVVCSSTRSTSYFINNISAVASCQLPVVLVSVPSGRTAAPMILPDECC